MARIVSIGTFDPPHVLTQDKTVDFARDHFRKGFEDIGRLLDMFDNALIAKRHFCMPMEWYSQHHSLQERNDLYIELATEYGIAAIAACLENTTFLKQPVDSTGIEAIFFMSTTGMATPSIEARIMNHLPFSPHTKRIPVWGLGCAGGVAGIARAHDYCSLFPKAKVLVMALELCSLTFQAEDLSKSNLVAASLFGDGVACALVVGDDAVPLSKLRQTPRTIAYQSTLMPDSERVMGWDVKDNGLFVVFSRDIPDIIRRWLKSNIDEFLTDGQLSYADIKHFIAHPGGRKVLEAYQDALGLTQEMTTIPRRVLREHGNMSSPSVLYVLKEYMQSDVQKNDRGLMTALGPGFSSELMLVEWQ